MIRKIVCILLLLGSIIVANSQKEWLAIHHFQSSSTEKQNALMIENTFKEKLLENKFYNIKSSKQERQLISETQIEEVKELEEGKIKGAVTLGKRLQVTKLLKGSLTEKDNQDLSLAITLIDISNAKVLYQNTIKAKSIEAIKAKIDQEVLVLQQFTEIQGRIVGVEDKNRILINFSKADPIHPDQVLQVYRPKGSLLIPIATLQVNNIQDTNSMAMLLKRDQDFDVKKGDIVKLSLMKSVKELRESLKIDVNSSWVSFEIDGIKQKDLLMKEKSYYINLEEGAHVLKFYKQGFVDQFGASMIEKKITIKKDQSSAIKIQFFPQKQKFDQTIQSADLHFTTQPSGATVFLNGREIGETSLIENIPLGDVELTFKKYLYHDKTINYTISKQGIHHLGNILLKENFALIKLSSSPSGAKVYLDQAYIGETPLEKKVQSGPYQLRVEKDLYYTHQSEITLKDSGLVMQSFALKPHFATLSLAVKPNGAQIFLNDKYLGTSREDQRFNIKNLSVDKHEIKITHPNYQKRLIYPSLNDGEVKELNVNLKLKFSKLNIDAKSEGDLYIDGIKIGVLPIEGYLISEGHHQIEVKPKHPDAFYAFSKILKSIPGKTTSLHDVLRNKKGNLSVFVYEKEKLIPAQIYLKQRDQKKVTSPYTFEGVNCGQDSLMIKYQDKIFQEPLNIEYKKINKIKVHLEKFQSLKKEKKYFLGLGIFKENQGHAEFFGVNDLQHKSLKSTLGGRDLLLTGGRYFGKKHLRKRVGISFLHHALKGQLSQSSNQHIYPYRIEKNSIYLFSKLDYFLTHYQPVNFFTGLGISAFISDQQLVFRDSYQASALQLHRIKQVRLGIGLMSYIGLEKKSHCLIVGYKLASDSGGKARDIVLENDAIVKINNKKNTGFFIMLTTLF